MGDYPLSFVQIKVCPRIKNFPKGAKGIYRYIRENGEIVYIGRGNIFKRLQSQERVEWDFDMIEIIQVRTLDHPDNRSIGRHFGLINLEKPMDGFHFIIKCPVRMVLGKRILLIKFGEQPKANAIGRQKVPLLRRSAFCRRLFGGSRHQGENL